MLADTIPVKIINIVILVIQYEDTTVILHMLLNK